MEILPEFNLSNFASMQAWYTFQANTKSPVSVLCRKKESGGYLDFNLPSSHVFAALQRPDQTAEMTLPVTRSDINSGQSIFFFRQSCSVVCTLDSHARSCTYLASFFVLVDHCF